jgi:membrane protease YdiL (CAAX protease family)
MMGELPSFEREVGDGLIWWVGIVAGMGMVFGEFHNLGGPPIPKGIWRLSVHGILSLSALSLWFSLERKQGRAVSILSMLLVLSPILFRIFWPGAPKLLRQNPLYLGLPVAASTALALWSLRQTGQKLSDWGIGFGRWRWWAPRAGLVLLAILPCAWIAMSSNSELAAFYPTWRPARSDGWLLSLQQLGYGLDLLGWEFLFRGFLLFAFARRGDAVTGIWVQCFPFFLLHAEKPYLEMITSFYGGLLSGWFCLSARSFVPLFLLHWVQISAVSIIGFLLRN